MGKFQHTIKNHTNILTKNFSTIIKSICILFTAVLFLLLPAETVSAAPGINLYNNTTKKKYCYTDQQVIVTYNDKKISIDHTPGILVNGISLVPYVDIFANSGIAADCVWKEEQGTLSIQKSGITIKMTLGKTEASVNGRAVSLPAAPVKIRYIDAGNITKILVPSRFVCETLGYGYTWHSDTSTVEIKKSNIILSYNDGKSIDYSGVFGQVTIDGSSVNLGSMPSIITNNITMLRAKKIFTDAKIGAKYLFNKADQTITISKGGIELVMKIGSTTAYLNGKAQNLDMAPVIVTNRKTKTSYVMVPGYFTASSLGFRYTWNNANRTSVITTEEDNTKDGDSKDDTDTKNSGGKSSDVTITETGTILNQWNSDGSLTGNGSSPKELNSDITPMENGIIYAVSRDYSNIKMNSEVYAISSSVPIGKVTADKSGKSLKIYFPGIKTYDQMYQIYGSSGNLVNTVNTTNQSGGQSGVVDFSLIPEQYTYDLTISEDRMVLYVTIYVNSLSNIKIGTNSTQDYISITGLFSPKATVTRQNNMLFIDIPYAVDSFGDQNIPVSGSKYLNLFCIVSTLEKTQIILGIGDNCNYGVSEKANQYNIVLQSSGNTGNQDSKDGQKDNSQSGQSGQKDDGQSGQTGDNSTVTDKSKYEIIIPKPEGISKDMLTDNDDYYNNRFSIILPGDYSAFYTGKQIQQNSGVIKDVSVFLNSGNKTEIRITTTKLQGYEYAADKDNIYINIGNPRDIYKNIVVLDPGHGGSANGAHYFSTDEKDINYKILYTIGKKYFNSDASKLKVYYTRETDTDKSLSERASFAGKVGADLFVSLHMNASTYSGAYGTEVYYSDHNNQPNRAGLTSKKLAALLLYNLTDELGTSNRGEKSEIYTVVYKNTVPAVLIELGFLSNKNDFSLLSDSEFQNKAAKTIYDTLLQIFKEYPTGR